MLNNESPARTAADSITKDEDMQVSQHRSKTTVTGMCCGQSTPCINGDFGGLSSILIMLYAVLSIFHLRHTLLYVFLNLVFYQLKL
jgi:hypothetical protein